MAVPFFLLALACPLIGLTVLILIIIAIVKATRRGSTVVIGQSQALEVMTLMGDDGFWLDSCPGGPGSIIHYHYWSNGIRYGGQIPFQPGLDGRQFVYTGMRPEQVAILQIVGASAGFGYDPGIVVVEDSGPVFPMSIDNPPDPGNSGGSGFPSAY